MCGDRRAWSALSVEHANSELKQGLELSKKLQQGILKYALPLPCHSTLLLSNDACMFLHLL